MFFDAKFFALLIFILLNFLILFFVRTRTTTVTSLIIAHLIAALFFSLSIANYNSFKEIVLALIVYSMVILFLVSNYSAVQSEGKEAEEIKPRNRPRFFIPLICTAILPVFIGMVFATKNVSEISNIVQEKKSLQTSESLAKSKAAMPDIESEINTKKMARLKTKLSDNFLLKRSSDVMLIIVALTVSLLILRTQKD